MKRILYSISLLAFTGALSSESKAALEKEVTRFIKNACKYNKILPTVQCFIERGIDVNYTNTKTINEAGDDALCGTTLLHRAVRNTETAAVRFLLDHGARVNVYDNWDETPLHHVVYSQIFPDELLRKANAEIILLLLKKDLQKNLLTSKNIFNETPLDQAVRGDLDLAKFLLQ